MNLSVETIADALERYAACLRAGEPGAIRMRQTIQVVHLYRAHELERGADEPEIMRSFLAAVRDARSSFAPTELVEVFLGLLPSSDADERAERIALKPFEALLETLRGI